MPSSSIAPVRPLKRSPVPLTPVTANIPESVAADRAIREVVGVNDLSLLPESFEGNTGSSAFLLDVTKEMHSAIASSALQDSFTAEMQAATSNEERDNILLRYSSEVNKDTADIRTLSYLNYLRNTPQEEHSLDGYNSYYNANFTIENLQSLRTEYSQPLVDEMRNILNGYAADKVLEGATEVTTEILQASFQPFQDTPLAEIASEAGILSDEETGFFSGSARQRIRDALAAMPDERRLEVIKNFIDILKRKERDPMWAVALTDFGVIDFMQSVFSDSVLEGRPTEDTVDVWLNNFISILDATLLAGTVARVAGRGGRSLGGLVSNSGSRPSLRIANSTSTPAGRSVGDALRTDPRTREILQVDEVEVLAADLPKPESILSGMQVIPDRIRAASDEAAILRTRVIELANEVPRRWHSTPNKVDLVAQEMEALANSTRGVVRRASSTIARLVNSKGGDLGFRTRALIGATESSGWKGHVGFDDVTNVIQDFNPEAGIIEIVQRNADGGLDTIYTAARQADGMAGLNDIKPFLARAVGVSEDSEFFIRVTKDRYYTPEDTLLFGDNPVMRSGPISRLLQTPFSKFDREVYDQVNLTFGTEQVIHKELGRMLDNVFGLPDSSKRKVFSTLEWTNAFAAEHKRNPTLLDYIAEFPDLNQDELTALVSLREAQDAWWQVLNIRLKRNWEARGFLTAYHDDLPHYHGKIVENPGPTVAFNPLTRTEAELTKKDLDDLYARGGRLLKVDMPIELPSAPRNKYDFVVIDKDIGYSIEALAPAVLDYHPGYFLKFYEDGFGLIKKYKKVRLNGKTIEVSPSREYAPEFATLIRTSNSQKRASELAARANARLVERAAKGRDVGYTYEAIPLRDLNMQEQTAYLSQLLNRQGRMFYDKRSYRMMENLDGEVTELMDPVKALERGVAAVSRQLGTEDTLRSLKTKFQEQYNDLLNPNEWRTLTSKEVAGRLRARIGNKSLDKRENRRWSDAYDLWQYIRTLEGADSEFFFNLRKWALQKAQVLGSTKADKFILETTPLQTARSFIFKAFMVTRPVRQLLLQSAQILFLGGIDPGYILTGRVLKDSAAVRIGVGMKMGVDGGWTQKILAKSMGMSTKEYETLVTKFYDSGLLDHVDVHAFIGNSRKFHRLGLPKTELGSVGQIPIKVGSFAVETLQRYGFDLGERNNLSFTYMVALRRLMRNRKYKKVTDLSVEEWDTVAVDASNLSFGMIRPNQAIYQSGPLSLATQFVSFGHKAALTMLGFNPSLKGSEVVKTWASGAVLFGGGMFGAREFTESWLADKTHNSEALSPKAREMFIEVASGGLVDYILNQTAQLLTDEWQDLDLSAFAPGPATLVTFYKGLIEAASEGPFYPVAFGPSGSITGNVMKALGTASALFHGDPDMSPAHKFRLAADQLLIAVFPGYSDYRRAMVAKKLGEWYSQAGMPTDLRPTWNALLARGLVGINTDQLAAYYSIRNDEMARKEHLSQIVAEDKANFRRVINLYLEGTETYEGLVQYAIMVGNMTAELSEDEQIQYYEMMQNADIGGFNMLEYLSTLVAENRFGEATLYDAGKLGIDETEWLALKGFVDRFQEDYSQARESMENRINTEETRFIEQDGD